MGEISPECTGGAWEGDERGGEAMFLGSNQSGERFWQRRIRVLVVDAPREFAWENLGAPGESVGPDTIGAARWSYTFTPVEGGTRVDETWNLLDNPRFQTLGEETLRGLESRNQAGMEQTLANLKNIFGA